MGGVRDGEREKGDSERLGEGKIDRVRDYERLDVRVKDLYRVIESEGE